MPSGPTVLLIDDNRGDIDLLRMALSDQAPHIDVDTACDGKEGWQVIERRAAEGRLPKLAVVDLNMPRVTGWQLLERLKDPRFARMWRVAYTGSPAPEDRAAAMAAGADECFVKPSDYDALERVAGSLTRYLQASDIHPRMPPS